MKKFATIFAVLFLVCFVPSLLSAQNIHEDAQLLYDEAMRLKARGNNVQAVEAFEKALRIDRTVLALNDDGLVDMLRDHVQDLLDKSPDDVKQLETMGFIYAVCFSDNLSAIENYERVVELVTDETVKERTKNLIERLRATEEVMASYRGEVTAQLRDERLRAWSELEKSEKFAEEQYEKERRASDLQQAFSDREELQNLVPQLEDELNELQEAYDKANRLWFSLKDELYERRRRRLKDDIAAKTEELKKAKGRLDSAESIASRIESELAQEEEEEKDSAFRSYDSDETTYKPFDDSVENVESDDDYDDDYDHYDHYNSDTEKSLSDLIDSL